MGVFPADRPRGPKCSVSYSPIRTKAVTAVVVVKVMAVDLVNMVAINTLPSVFDYLELFACHLIQMLFPVSV